MSVRTSLSSLCFNYKSRERLSDFMIHNHELSLKIELEALRGMASNFLDKIRWPMLLRLSGFVSS